MTQFDVLLSALRNEGVSFIIILEALIRSKRAAGRAKDLEVVAELEAIREERSETE